MNDEELQVWWPDLGQVVAALRCTGHSALADRLVDVVTAGSSASEIVGGVGFLLHQHRALRPDLDAPASAAWCAVMSDVYHAFPGLRLRHWLQGWRFNTDVDAKKSGPDASM